jgi:hypothetical protein
MNKRLEKFIKSAREEAARRRKQASQRYGAGDLDQGFVSRRDINNGAQRDDFAHEERDAFTAGEI